MFTLLLFFPFFFLVSETAHRYVTAVQGILTDSSDLSLVRCKNTCFSDCRAVKDARDATGEPTPSMKPPWKRLDDMAQTNEAYDSGTTLSAANPKPGLAECLRNTLLVSTTVETISLRGERSNFAGCPTARGPYMITRRAMDRDVSRGSFLSSWMGINCGKLGVYVLCKFSKPTFVGRYSP